MEKVIHHPKVIKVHNGSLRRVLKYWNGSRVEAEGRMARSE